LHFNNKEITMQKLALMLILLFLTAVVNAQEANAPDEKRVSTSESAVALDATGAGVIEAKLLTTSLNGAPDTPVTNTRIILRNISPIAFGFVSGVVTFYDGSGVRCGEGVFKADVLAPNESFETDTPGVRIHCAASSWRVVATSLVPRVAPKSNPTSSRLIITIDGDQHPLQLDKPLTLSGSEKPRVIVVRELPND
jgi:hypothetical protein